MANVDLATRETWVSTKKVDWKVRARVIPRLDPGTIGKCCIIFGKLSYGLGFSLFVLSDDKKVYFIVSF